MPKGTGMVGGLEDIYGVGEIAQPVGCLEWKKLGTAACACNVCTGKYRKAETGDSLELSS